MLWQGGFDLGTVNAELPAQSDHRNGSAGSVHRRQQRWARESAFRVASPAYLSTHLAIEGGVRVTRPKLDIKLSADFESAPDQTATETLTQYVIDGSAVLNLAPFHQWPSRAVHCRGRRLHPRSPRGQRADRDRDRVSRPRGNQVVVLAIGRHRLGIRGEGGFSIRDGGFDFRDERRTVPIATAGLVYIFDSGIT